MKLLYITNISTYTLLKKSNGHGIANKIETQKKQFMSAGIRVTFVESRNRERFIAGIPVFATGTCKTAANIGKYDAIYIRFFSCIPFGLIRFVRTYKKKRPNGKVLLEIPTYPYKSELCHQYNKLFYLTTQMGLFLLRQYLDHFILISSGCSSIMRIPAVNIRNFVDYDTVSVRKPVDSTDAIHIICVASFNIYHGYDRLIEGLKNYIHLPHHENVVLHLVGSTDNIQRLGLIQAVKQYGLKKNVICHGILDGDELSAVYGVCDLACCTLGIHRKGLRVSSELKSHEYAAKGLPMLTASCLDIYHKDTAAYICKFPADESPVDFEKVVRFYHSIYDNQDRQSIANTIRNTFKKYCSAAENFKEVIALVKEPCR